jgi:hypothetical protein
MIQSTGTITMSDGVTSFINPLINVALSYPTKGEPSIVTAQVCKMVGEKVEKIMGGQLHAIPFVQPNPDFESAQEALKTALESAYPNVTFEIV